VVPRGSCLNLNIATNTRCRHLPKGVCLVVFADCLKSRWRMPKLLPRFIDHAESKIGAAVANFPRSLLHISSVSRFSLGPEQLLSTPTRYLFWGMTILPSRGMIILGFQRKSHCSRKAAMLSATGWSCLCYKSPSGTWFSSLAFNSPPETYRKPSTKS
jgi:hypothetical protein